MREQVYREYDSAGVATSVAYDFKGGLVEGQRQLASDYTQLPDWSFLAELDVVADIETAVAAANTLEVEVFTTTASFDALGRPVTRVTPDSTELTLTYNDGALLERVDARLRGAANTTSFVENIDYDVQGRRSSIHYGNGTTTSYAYDPKSLRLTALQTTRDNAPIAQDLGYIYDAVGNIVEVTDGVAGTTHYNGAAVSGGQEFVYNAVYELIEATGREHNSVSQPTSEHFPMHLHPQDGAATRRYREHYAYDVVGNILQMQHVATGGEWTRRHNYTPQLGTQEGNRLLATSAPGDGPGEFGHAYTYDAHGNMTSMPHLPTMTWDEGDRLQSSTNGDGGTTYYVYDGGGERVRKVRVNATESSTWERVYLGGFELYRRRVGGVLREEIESLHISDDSGRICLVETRTVDEGADVASPASLQRYQYSNHLGTVGLELTGEGEVLSYEEYHPYGTTAYRAGTSQTDTNPKRFGFTGKERDEETGLNYHGARYYASWLGRWTASDPIGLGDGVNRYRYARNRPPVLNDPNGMLPPDGGVVDRLLYRKHPALAERAAKSSTISPAKVIGAAQMGFGGLEIKAGLAIEAGSMGFATPIAAALIVHGLDNVMTGAKTVVTDKPTRTLTERSATGLAEEAGADPATARTIGEVADAAVGLGEAYAAGKMLRTAAGGVGDEVAEAGAKQELRAAPDTAPPVNAGTTTPPAPRTPKQRRALEEKLVEAPPNAHLVETDAAGEGVHGAQKLGGFAEGVEVDEIAKINQSFGGTTTLTGSVDTALTNAARYDGFFNKSAAVIRDIAGRHLFDNGNKRTAQVVYGLLRERNGITSGVGSAEVRGIIGQVARGELTGVEDIAKALRGF